MSTNSRVNEHRGHCMAQLIPDTTTDARMEGLEEFLQRYLGPRRSEFGASEDEVRSVQMPAPLQRLFKFAGRWPAPYSLKPFVNRFCIQDHLGSLAMNDWAPALRFMDNLLVFVTENQGVWVAATEPAGSDPPVWITEQISDSEPRRTWRALENPLSHFLVSFVLQELMFGSERVAVAPGALEKFEATGLPIQPLWINGEYAWDFFRSSYYLVGNQFLVRRAPDEGDGDDWYGCKDAAGAEVLISLGLPTALL